MMAFDTGAWQSALDAWLEARKTLAAKWARDREMQMIPVTVATDREIVLTPGVHSELIRGIIASFAPRFAPGAEVIYVGDTGDKAGYFKEERLLALGVMVDRHGKMPDVVYVTAFQNRTVMGRYLSDISWETEVWCAGAPSHLIHFAGERFLGPYEPSTSGRGSYAAVRSIGSELPRQPNIPGGLEVEAFMVTSRWSLARPSRSQ